jgi:hypothetical protein
MIGRRRQREMPVVGGTIVQLVLAYAYAVVVLQRFNQAEAWTLKDRWEDRPPMMSGTSRTRMDIPEENEGVFQFWNGDPNRRQVLTASLSALSTTLIAPLPTVEARNLPTSNGADTSKAGTVQALLPVLELRSNLQRLKQSLQQEHNQHGASTATSAATSILAKIPQKESDFKRLFDAYSDQVSYKQKFLDQNAFLVYYTQGYDGPGRKTMEQDVVVNERQTLQFGARNEAWVAWESFLAEQEYYQKTYRSSGGGSGNEIPKDEPEDFAELMKCLSDTIQAMDAYLQLSPPQDVAAANDILVVSSRS